MWVWGPLMMVIWVVVVAAAVYWVAKALRSPQRDPARRILDERYARGELSTEEYRERLETLR